MPRQVDHDQRREELSRAVWEVVGAHGLDGLTLRTVAAAAQCTTGRVAHYFENKNALLIHARDVMHRRMAARIDELPEHDDPRRHLRSVLLEGLPLDEDRRLGSTVWAYFLLAARTDPELRRQHDVRHQSWLTRLTGLLRQAYQSDGGLVPRDLERRVRGLVAVVDGLSLSAVATPEMYPADLIVAVLDTHLSLLWKEVE